MKRPALELSDGTLMVWGFGVVEYYVPIKVTYNPKKEEKEMKQMSRADRIMNRKLDNVGGSGRNTKGLFSQMALFLKEKKNKIFKKEK